jgi:hypothetical protein
LGETHPPSKWCVSHKAAQDRKPDGELNELDPVSDIDEKTKALTEIRSVTKSRLVARSFPWAWHRLDPATGASASIPNIVQGINSRMQAILAWPARPKSARTAPPALCTIQLKSNKFRAIRRRKWSEMSRYLLMCPYWHSTTVSKQDSRKNVSACFHATKAAPLRMRTSLRRGPVETPMGLRMAKPRPKTVPWASAESRRPSFVAENYPRQAHNRKISKHRG